MTATSAARRSELIKRQRWSEAWKAASRAVVYLYVAGKAAVARKGSVSLAELWHEASLHLAAVGMLVLVALLPKVSVPEHIWSVPLSRAVILDSGSLREPMPSSRDRRLVPPTDHTEVLRRQALLHTVKGEYPNLVPITYQVKSGDTISQIAENFHLDMRSVFWANEALVKRPDLISVGQELVILPVDGAYHTVVQGDTLESIAQKYDVSPEAILAYKGNEIADPDNLTVGMKLVVPGAKLPDLPPRVVNTPRYTTQHVNVANPQQGSGNFIWPVSGTISQGCHSGHIAVDIAGPRGSPIVAVDDGTVVLVSWMRTSYGYHVIIDHGGGIQTLYAHLSEILVEVGQDVSKGEAIGKRGSTGRSTGPHLHFEVRENGVRRNPFNYLP